jgi:hypothetical protein
MECRKRTSNRWHATHLGSMSEKEGSMLSKKSLLVFGCLSQHARASEIRLGRCFAIVIVLYFGVSKPAYEYDYPNACSSITGQTDRKEGLALPRASVQCGDADGLIKLC